MNDIVPLLRRPYRAEEPDQAARAGLVLAAYPPKPPDSPPVGVTASSVQAWFDAAIDDAIPTADGTLATAQHIADVVARRAKADNTRRAYRAGVRAWCAWCDQHGLTPLPARPADIAAFLAAQRYPGSPPSVTCITSPDAPRRRLPRGSPRPLRGSTSSPSRRARAQSRSSPPRSRSCVRSWRQLATTWPGCATGRCCSWGLPARF